MKKISVFLLVLLLSCQNKKQLKIYYPTKNTFLNLRNPSKLKLQSFTSFGELVDTLQHYKYKGKVAIFNFKNKNTEYNFQASTFFGDCGPPIIKLKNVIGISPDSIYKNNKYYPLDSLCFLLKKDLLNNGRDIEFSKNSKKLIVSLTISEKAEITELKKLLLKVFKSYNKIKKETIDSIIWNLQFNKFIQLTPPPTSVPIENE